MSNKKAVIFDGDGTLWRPIGHDKTTRPDSIYKGDRVEKGSHLRLELVAGILEMLQNLKARGYDLFVVSAHPTPGPEALAELESKIVSLGVKNLIDGYFCSDGGDRDGKAEIIRTIVTDFELDASEVYMIGDSYYYDYEAGLKANVNSFFIRNDYCKQPLTLPVDAKVVEEITDLMDQLKS
jgi:phosphoglycolate phosphatase-like HAD superfamily hydrolase